MYRSDSRVIFFLTFILLGIVLAVQFRSTLYTNTQRDSSALNAEMLISQLDEGSRTEISLRAEIEKYMTSNENYIKAYIENRNDDILRMEWEIIRLKAGLTDVKGPGIIIKLDDALARQSNNTQFLIIHDQDVRIILNELKKAGSQAISINGERIISTSEQVCAGPTILINRNRYAVPYIINAIGDPDILYEGLSMCERIGLMIKDNIRVEIKKTKEIIVPKYSNNAANLISGLEVVKK